MTAIKYEQQDKNFIRKINLGEEKKDSFWNIEILSILLHLATYSASQGAHNLMFPFSQRNQRCSWYGKGKQKDSSSSQINGYCFFFRMSLRGQIFHSGCETPDIKSVHSLHQKTYFDRGNTSLPYLSILKLVSSSVHVLHR